MAKPPFQPLNLPEHIPFAIPPAGASVIETMLKVVHPCTGFAKSAGYESWAEVVEAARSGKIVQGQGPRMGKTTLDVDLFCREVREAELQTEYIDFGLFAVALPERFQRK